MPKPVSPSRVGNLKQKIKTRYLRGCGEQHMAYRVEELDLLARWAAETALQVLDRGDLAPDPEPPAAPEPEPAAPVVEPEPRPLPLGLSLEDVALLELVAEGLADKQIARRLGVTERQATRRVRNLYGRLDARGRVALVVAGYEAGFLGSGPRSAREAARTAPVGAAGAKSTPSTLTASAPATGAPEAVEGPGGAA